MSHPRSPLSAAAWKLLAAGGITLLVGGACAVCMGKVFPRVLHDEDAIVEKVTDLYTVEDYLHFLDSLKAGEDYSGSYVNLRQDIAVNGADADYDLHYCEFAGILDGNGYAIDGSSFLKPMEELWVNTADESATANAVGSRLQVTGVIANLELTGSNLPEGEEYGIAMYITNLGSVLNCSLDAGLADGYLSGVMKNCIVRPGAETQELTDELNQNLSVCAYSSDYQVDGWTGWKYDETTGRADLAEKDTDTLTEMYAVIGEGTGQYVLKGYYSEAENAWCIPILSGFGDTETKIHLGFTQDGYLDLVSDADTREFTEEWKGITYPIRVIADENTPALMLTTNAYRPARYLATSKQNKFAGQWTLVGSKGTVLSHGKLDKLKGHGNDSFLAAKKSYGITLGEKTDLLGLGASKNYVLLAGYRENSLMAYKATNDLARSVGMDYAQKTTFVQLYLDGEYMGMYFLTGKIECGESRIDIADIGTATEKVNNRKPDRYNLAQTADENHILVYRDGIENPKDITGGYILEKDNLDYDIDNSRFVTQNGTSIVLRNLPAASFDEINYIYQYWSDFENAVFAEDGYNDKGVYYADYIDMESFAQHWIFYELDTEISMGSSMYYFKDSEVTGDGLLHACYPWDMEHSLRSTNHVTASWIGRAGHGIGSDDEIWVRLYRHKDFAELVEKVWNEQFYPAICDSLDETIPEKDDTDGLASMSWYGTHFAKGAALSETRWAESDFQAKVEKIRDTYDRRGRFLSKSFSLYDLGYEQFFEEDGILYGMYEDGEFEEVPVK